MCGEFTTEPIPEAFTPEHEVILYVNKVHNIVLQLESQIFHNSQK